MIKCGLATSFSFATRDNKMKICTSLAPKGIDNQARAIASWRNLEFEVVSFNTIEEIRVLETHFPQVEFVESERTAQQLVGRPLVFFDDFLAYFKQGTEKICSIVNSDIILEANFDLQKFIAKEADGGIVFGSRVDIKNENTRNGIPYKLGFDYFFFDKDIIGLYPESTFCIGAPWWDYWIVFMPLLNEIPIKLLTGHIAFHVEHKLNWNNSIWVSFCEEFIKGANFSLSGMENINFSSPKRSTMKFCLNFADEILSSIYAKANKVELCS